MIGGFSHLLLLLTAGDWRGFSESLFMTAFKQVSHTITWRRLVNVGATVQCLRACPEFRSFEELNTERRVMFRYDVTSVTSHGTPLIKMAATYLISINCYLYYIIYILLYCYIYISFKCLQVVFMNFSKT